MIDIGPFQLGQMDIGPFQSESQLASGINTSGNLFVHGFDLINDNIETFVGGHISFNKNTILSGQYIYWTDVFSTVIERIKIDGTDRTIIVSGLSISQGIYVDQDNNYLYWIDRGTDKIQRSNLDGTNVIDLVTSGLTDPQGIFVDIINNKIYWVDFTLGNIKRCDTNGSNIEIFASGLSGPEDVFVDNVNDKVYWTESTNPNDSVKRANLDGSNVEVIVSGINNPEGIDLDLTNNKIYFAESDGKKIRRCNLDGTSLETLVDTIGTPVGLDIDVDNDKIYWVEITPDTIQKSNLDGSNQSTIISGLASRPQQLDLYTSPEIIFTNLFIHGNESLNDQINLVLPYPSFITDTLNAFLKVPEFIDNSIVSFMNGHIVSTSGVDLFTIGNSLLTDELTLFLMVPETINNDANLFIKGTVSGLPVSELGDDDFGFNLDIVFARSDYSPQIIGRFITDPNTVSIQIYNIISGVNTLVSLISDECYQIGDTGRWAWSTSNLPSLQETVNQFIFVMTGDNLETFKGKFIIKNSVNINSGKIPRDNSHIRRV